MRLQSRGLRLALVLMMSVGYVAWHSHTHSAYAKAHGGGDDDSGDDDAGGGGDDDDDDKGGGGGGGGDDDDDGPEEGQPEVTAGGLYTLKTYPVREISRPLSMTQGIAQARLSLGTDLSAKGAFKTFGANLEGIYGYKDNFSIIGGLTDAYNFKQFGMYVGFEGAIAYDLIDIRVAANIHRNALAQYDNFCNPPVSPGEKVSSSGTCGNPMAAQEALPSGKFDHGNVKFSIDLGFPFRYAINPSIAIVALQTLMSIDFNSVNTDFQTVSTSTVTDPATMMDHTVQTASRTGNSATPDLNPSVGLATNPIPQLSLVVFAQLRIPDFDTSAGAFQVPVTGRVEFSPNQKVDVGLEFTLLNVKPPDGQSPIDNRFLSLFMQFRAGK